MSLLRRLCVGIAALFGFGCGPRAYTERLLLDPCITDGASLSVYVQVETGTAETTGGGFNPTGPRTTRTVDRADLYRADFALSGSTATLIGSEHLLGREGKALDQAITTTDGYLGLTRPPPDHILVAPLGNYVCEHGDGRFTVYADNDRTKVVDRGDLPKPSFLRFTWSGERIYAIDSDAEGRISRIRHTRVGSGGVWEEIGYDAAATPIDADPGQIMVEAFDLLDGEPILLASKSYVQTGGMMDYRSSTYALVRGQRLVVAWTGDPPGWIRPDLRALVGWHRRYGSLQATLTLRSLDDGTERSLAVDATPALPR